jgi:ADP-heptose:LPS heptosyltransferase
MKLYSVLEHAGYQVVMSGSEPEGEMIEAMAAEMGVAVRKITGETDLRTLAAALSMADVVVANSTGPLHLAVAVGTKVVGLYPGKAVMSPQRWGPLGRHDRVLVPTKKECDCPEGHCTCMLTITVDRTAREVTDLFNHAD